MFDKILVPVDGSETAARGLDEAIHLAKERCGTLHLFYGAQDAAFAVALQSCDPCAMDWRSVFEEEGREFLEKAASRAREADVTATSHLSTDYTRTIAERVAAEAELVGADVIVIGTHGRRGLGRALVGSVAEAILREAPVPVLLVRTDGKSPEAVTETGESATEKSAVPA